MASPLEVTIGMEKGFAARPGGAAVLRRLVDMGATSVETYVRWIDFEPEQGRWDWSVFDADLEALRAHGLRWVPFLIAGPWYATPEWFRRSEQSVFARCLEHGRETGTQSIWSPHLFPQVRRLMAAFATRYGVGGASESVESLLLGVTGDYGEAIFTVVGNWPGDYHGHAGYWCGDRYALADFRRWTQARYGDLAGLRQAWGDAPSSWDGLTPPSSPPQAPSPRAWLDFVEWYRGAMTAWAERWLVEARTRLPGSEIYLCTGGDMTPSHGSDFSEQCRVAAATGAGVRITNEGSDYVQNLMLTRLAASAARHHGGFFGFEPAATVNATGIAVREFNATGSGARQLHEYQGNVVAERGTDAVLVPGAAEAWQRGLPCLTRRHPRYEVALIHSLPDLALRQAGILGGALGLARTLRPVCDFEVLDDHLVAAGALQGLRAVFLAPARLWSAETLRRLQGFAAEGGVVVAAGVRPEALENAGGADAAAVLFGFGERAEEVFGISAVRPADGARTPEYAALPPLHLAHAYRDLDPAAVPLLRVRHTPASGQVPLVLWYRPWGRGAAVFHTGGLASGDDWMAVPGAAESIVRDLLQALPRALGLPEVEVATTRGVVETRTDDGVLGWNATGAAREWRGGELGAGGMGERRV